MTEKDVSVLLGILKTAYPRFYSSIDTEELREVIKLWTAMLSDTTLDVAKLALYKLIATCKYPPTIAEMRECIADVKYIPVEDSGEAWGEVKRAIRNYGYYREGEALRSMSESTCRVVIRMGWKELCMSENEMADRAHFLKIYDAMANGIERNRLLPDALREKIGRVSEKSC